jgi:PhzF family phenazine biosynthesis protein
MRLFKSGKNQKFMEIKIDLVKAFTKNAEQGNPAGVVLDANNLNSEKMLEISLKLGFSESVFVLDSTVADFKFRFFSPSQEVDLCGHATIAACYDLIKNNLIKMNEADLAKNVSIETNVGVILVECFKDGLIMMIQKKSEVIEYSHDKKRIAEALGIEEEQIEDWPIQTVSTGTAKLMIPIKSLKSLFEINCDFEKIIEYCKNSGARGFYVFTTETIDENNDFHARQFNPLAGINEDPITGVAAGSLGAYLQMNELSEKKEFVVEQGNVMNQAGKIFVEVENKIKVGGYAVCFGEKNCTKLNIKSNQTRDHS